MEQTKLVSVIVGCGGCGDSDEWTMYECELYINRVGGIYTEVMHGVPRRAHIMHRGVEI